LPFTQKSLCSFSGTRRPGLQIGEERQTSPFAKLRMKLLAKPREETPAVSLEPHISAKMMATPGWKEKTGRVIRSLI